MPGVTISAGYGAGGSIIAPEVARQLGLPLLDRAISSHVAARLRVTVREAEGGAIRRAGAVILGRGGGAAFYEEPGVLRVRLFGPAQARAVQAARIEDLDASTARRRLPEVDRARAHYVRRLYGADIDDPALYHLQIDSTAVSLDACAAVIVAAYRGLAAL